MEWAEKEPKANILGFWGQGFGHQGPIFWELRARVLGSYDQNSGAATVLSLSLSLSLYLHPIISTNSAQLQSSKLFLSIHSFKQPIQNFNASPKKSRLQGKLNSKLCDGDIQKYGQNKKGNGTRRLFVHKQTRQRRTGTRVYNRHIPQVQTMAKKKLFKRICPELTKFLGLTPKKYLHLFPKKLRSILWFLLNDLKPDIQHWL